MAPWTPAAVLAAVVIWQWNSARALETQLGAARAVASGLPSLRREHARWVMLRRWAETQRAAAGVSGYGANRPPKASRQADGSFGEFATAPALTWVGSAEWRNVGRATPRAAFETVLWAASNARLDDLAAAIELDPASRAIVKAILDGLPEGAREQYGSPERVVAMFLARDSNFARAEFYDLEEVAQGSVRGFAVAENEDGDTQWVDYTFRPDAGQWCLVPNTGLIDRAVQEITNAKPLRAPSNNVLPPMLPEIPRS